MIAMRRTHHSLLGLFLFLFLVGAESSCKPAERDDDALEPNDSVATATRLEAGVPVEARVNQRNADYFCLAVDGPGTATFTFAHRGLENCAFFEVVGPDGAVLHEDHELLCSSPREADTTDRVTVTAPEDGSRTLEIATEVPGDYCVAVREMGMADNVLPFSWDYRVEAAFAAP